MKREFSEQEIVRRNKATELQKQNIDPFSFPKETNTNSDELKIKYGSLTKEEMANKQIDVKLYGRIMLKREAGKALFFNIKDNFGNIQCYAKSEEVGNDNFELLTKLDLGDIVHVDGVMMKTNTEELTVRLKKITLLTKSLKPLPEKHLGLQDVEEKYRKRYLDLITNDETKSRFILRTKIISALRNYLFSENYLEVETPILQSISGGAAAKPFKTHHNALDMSLFLRIAPELYLKRLIVGGFDRVFEIGRNFRNEGISTRHNPEFTMIELYQVNATYETMMELAENLFTTIAKECKLSTTFKYGDMEINFSKPWKRIHMIDAIKEATNVDFWKITNLNDALAEAKKHKLELPEFKKSIGHIINEFFETYVEKTLINPTFVYGHPIEISPLAKKNKDNPNFTDRFELFIGAREYANAFSELNDPIDQLSRFEEQVKEKEKGNEEASEIDWDFIEALEYGMPPTAGMGIGIDRLVMLLTNAQSIRDVLFFPHLKNANK